MSEKCPKCGSSNIQTERRSDGFHHCMDCRHSWKIGESQPKPTNHGRIDRYCKSCGNVTVADAGYYAGSSFYQCETCGRRGMQDIFPIATVFHKITASPEVLAPEFVEMMYDRVSGDYRYYSMLTGEFYNNREEAIAATVARLKEVEK